MYSSLIVVPFLIVILLNLPLRQFMTRIAFALCTVVFLAQSGAVILPSLGHWASRIDEAGAMLGIHFAADNLTLVMLLSIAIVLLVVLWVQKQLNPQTERMFLFVNVLLLLLAGLNGIVLVRDIFSLYVFLEITAVGSFILIAFDKGAEAFEAAFKYLVLSVVATILMLGAIALLVMIAGDTGFATISWAMKMAPDKTLITFAVGLFLCAAFIKAGLMPFHGWLPGAYSAAPLSVSVLLAGIVTKTVGVYTLLRIVYSVFGFNPAVLQLLLVLGTISVVFGALAALGQNNFRRMLAYSSISQMGYVVLGLASGSVGGLAGAILHLFNHSIFKTLLFVNAAAVESSTGKRDLENLSGLAKKMPVTGIASVLASLSCAGIPPLAGFWSKLMIIVALWMAGLYSYAIVAALASMLTLAYFLSLQRMVFFGKLREGLENAKEGGIGIIFPTILLALITIGVGIFFPFIVNIFVLPVLGG